ncbi:MAG: hypothetical protein ACR2HT_02860 [Pyrinomonadaceae bacterium]|jgi:hypothetical protein
MKDYRIFSTILIITFASSCNWYIFRKSTYLPRNRPEICVQVFDGTAVNADRLMSFSVEQLLVLQECGLGYYPHEQLQNFIADQDEYPVPELIKHMQTAQDEEFQHYLILDFVALTKSEKHNKRLLSDKDLVLTEVNETIQKMQSVNLKKYSEIEFNKIKRFFDNN